MYNDIFYSLFDGDEYTKFIKSVEREFRNSPEYLLWLSNKTHRDSCAVTDLEYVADSADIEVHHYQLTLWNWVELIVDELTLQELPLNSHFICMILDDIHLNNYVPYIALMHSYHNMITKRGEEDVLKQFPKIQDGIYEGNVSK